MSTAADIDRFYSMLLATGMPEREAARAAIYAQVKGLDALNFGVCVAFDKPNCGDWNCLNPAHQVLSS